MDLHISHKTSTALAALVGQVILGEKAGMHRVVTMALIASGAVIVEYAA